MWSEKLGYWKLPGWQRKELLVCVGTCYLLGDKQSRLLFVPFVPVRGSGTCHLPSSFPHTSRFLSVQRGKTVLTRCVCRLPFGSECVARGRGMCFQTLWWSWTMKY